MSETIRVLEKENPGISFAGKVGSVSARKNVLGSVSKKNKALADVKNTVYLRKTTKTEKASKKPLVFDDNQVACSEKLTKIGRRSPADTSAGFAIKEFSITKVSSDTTDIEKEILSLPAPSISIASDDDCDFDVDDCPSCIKNDDDNDWFENIGSKKYSDDDIMKICCDPVPYNGLSSPEPNVDDWYKMHYQSVSPTCLNEPAYNHASFSPEFKLPEDFYISHNVVPVTYD